jgi:hypothetical protein
MGRVRNGGWQFTVRSFLVVTAAVALLLVPVAWVTRERRQMVMAERQMLLAREVALRSVILEQERRFKAAPPPAEYSPPPAASSPERAPAPRETSAAVEQLRHENAGLKQQLEELRREVEQLKSGAEPKTMP